MDLRQVHGLTGFGNVMIDHPPESMVRLPHHPGDRQHGHLPDHGHDQGLKEQRESRSFPGPRDGHQMHAMFRTLDSRHPGVEIGRMLEEIEMPPDLLLGVIDRAILATDWTRKLATPWEVHMQVKALLLRCELNLAHHPRRN